MALSEKAKKALQIALASTKADDSSATEITNAIESGENAVAANVAVIADTSTASAEDVGDKVNEVIAALIAAGLMEA